MLRTSMLRFLIVIFCTLVSTCFTLSPVSAEQQTQPNSSAYNQWLKQQFSAQHQALIPKVTVVNMFVACNKARKTFSQDYQVADVIKHMPKQELSEKLVACLGNSDVQSEQAINFALQGCFYQQLVNLPEQARAEKLQQVSELLKSLPREEKQKSLTKCVTMQAIEYLQ